MTYPHFVVTATPTTGEVGEVTIPKAAHRKLPLQVGGAYRVLADLPDRTSIEVASNITGSTKQRWLTGLQVLYRQKPADCQSLLMILSIDTREGSTVIHLDGTMRPLLLAIWDALVEASAAQLRKNANRVKDALRRTRARAPMIHFDTSHFGALVRTIRRTCEARGTPDLTMVLDADEAIATPVRAFDWTSIPNPFRQIETALDSPQALEPPALSSPGATQVLTDMPPAPIESDTSEESPLPHADVPATGTDSEHGFVAASIRPHTVAASSFLADADRRRAIELRAMQLALEHYRRAWPIVQDVSRTEPFDLRCSGEAGELHVEVKGTTSDGSVVLLTRNEVCHAREHYPNVALFVVAQVTVGVNGVADGGKIIIYEPWKVDEHALAPMMFQCRLLPQTLEVD